MHVDVSFVLHFALSVFVCWECLHVSLCISACRWIAVTVYAATAEFALRLLLQLRYPSVHDDTVSMTTNVGTPVVSNQHSESVSRRGESRCSPALHYDAVLPSLRSCAHLLTCN